MALDLQFFVRKLVILVVLGDLGMQFNKGFFLIINIVSDSSSQSHNATRNLFKW